MSFVLCPRPHTKGKPRIQLTLDLASMSLSKVLSGVQRPKMQWLSVMQITDSLLTGDAFYRSLDFTVKYALNAAPPKWIGANFLFNTYLDKISKNKCHLHIPFEAAQISETIKIKWIMCLQNVGTRMSMARLCSWCWRIAMMLCKSSRHWMNSDQRNDANWYIHLWEWQHKSSWIPWV